MFCCCLTKKLWAGLIQGTLATITFTTFCLHASYQKTWRLNIQNCNFVVVLYDCGTWSLILREECRLQTKGFRQWYMTPNTARFFHIVHCLVFQRLLGFRNWIYFHPHVRVCEAPILLGSLEKHNLNHWAVNLRLRLALTSQNSYNYHFTNPMSSIVIIVWIIIWWYSHVVQISSAYIAYSPCA
jgi:hypothetical protein